MPGSPQNKARLFEQGINVKDIRVQNPPEVAFGSDKKFARNQQLMPLSIGHQNRVQGMIGVSAALLCRPCIRERLSSDKECGRKQIVATASLSSVNETRIVLPSRLWFITESTTARTESCRHTVGVTGESLSVLAEHPWQVAELWNAESQCFGG